MDADEFMIAFEALMQRFARAGAFEADQEFCGIDFDAVALLVWHYMTHAMATENGYPGMIRIDAGQVLDHGGLRPNDDAVIVLEYDLFGENAPPLTTRYNLADELLRYADAGEGGWDVARQIDQLEKTIARLRTGASERGWRLD